MNKRLLVVFIFICAFSVPSYAAVDLRNGLIGWWKMEEDSGASVLDASGNGHTGTITGATRRGSCIRGRCLNFDGNDLVAITSTATLNPTAAISVSVWIKPSTAAQETFATVINKRFNSAAPYNNWIIDVGQGGNTHEFCIANTAGGGPTFGQWCLTSGALSTRWTHIVGTYDGATSKLYLNGTEVASTNVAIALATSNNPVRFGTPEAVANYFIGLIDDARIYNRALSDEEVLALYQWKTKIGQSKIGRSSIGK